MGTKNYKNKFDYENRKSPEYIKGIMELLIEDDQWIASRRKCELDVKRQAVVFEQTTP